jgi:hypothetical protein
MPPEEWGPPIWKLFHTLCHKIKPEYFSQYGKELFLFIFRICCNLPCPECSQHAKQFLSKVSVPSLKVKEDLINIIYIFHNSVNQRKKKGLYSFENINDYGNNDIKNVYNQFIRVFHTKGNMNLLTESFQRDMLVKQFKAWLTKNHRIF